MKTFYDIMQKFESAKAKRDILQADIQMLDRKKRAEKRNSVNIEEALKIVQIVAKETQSKIKFHITEIVSTALSSVFDEPYEFCLDFVLQRNNTEAKIYFKKDGTEIDPMTEAGGGVVDIAAFALRIAAFTMIRPSTTKTIILDEPFRFLSSDLQHKAGEMLKMLSEKLGVQFIIVTHNETIIDCADRIFEVVKHNNYSEVNTIETI